MVEDFCMVDVKSIKDTIVNASDTSILIFKITNNDYGDNLSLEVFCEDILVENSEKLFLRITSGRGGKVETDF